MPLQKKLIQANEAGAWNSNNRQINFTIPSDIDIVDLSQSSIVLDIVITNKTTGANLGLYDMQFKNDYDARCLINSLKISTNKGGLVEEYQNSNVLRANLQAYNKSTELSLSQSWLGQGQLANVFGSFLTKYNIGNSMSLQQCAIPIPFKSICGIGNQQQWLNGNCDGTNVQVNLEYYSSTLAGLFTEVRLSDIACNDTVDGDSEVDTITITAVANNQCAIPWYVGQGVTIDYALSWTPITISGATQANPCVITLAQSPSDMELTNGSTITVSGFTAGWTGANGDFIVANINDGAKTLELTGLDSSAFGGVTGTPVGVLATGERDVYSEESNIESIAISTGNVVTITLNSIWGEPYYGARSVKLSSTASGIPENNLSYKINNAQLSIVQQIPLPSQMSAYNSILNKSIDIPFFTWGVERVNVPTVGANMKYNKLIDLLPNCRQVVIMVPLPASTDPLTSVQDNQSQYRFSVDTVYTTSRAIVPFDSLYYDTLINGLVNAKQPINNLKGTQSPVVWCQSIPVDGLSHQIQFEYTQNGNAGTANKVMYVFQCIDKVINTKSAMVMNA